MKLHMLTLLTLIFASGYVSAESSLKQVSKMVHDWNQNEPKSYKYTLKRGGVFGYTIYKISVKKGKCRARSRHITRFIKTRWEKDTCDGNTIRELILAVRDQETRGVFSSDISVDKNHPFVSSYFADPKTDETDLSWHFEITRFKVR